MFHYISLLFYNLSLQFYWLGIYLASSFNPQAKLWLEGRKEWKHRLKQINFKPGKRIWFHCASLGEFEQARPVIERIRSERKGDTIIITFFSPSGYEIRKNFPGADLITYLPIDTAANAKEFIDIIKPDLVLFVKYEFWFHYLNELHKENIPVILFSSVFRPDQIFFSWYGGLFRIMLKMFSKIFVQNKSSQELLQTISIDAEVAADTRFDRVYQIAQSKKSFPAIEKFKTGSKIFIAGSTWPKDEELLLQCINEDILKEYKYIIAPHNISQDRISELISSTRVKARRFSELTQNNADETDLVVIDNIGNLASLYAYGEIAYIGGGFNASVHNVLEAAVYEIPVIYGPNFKKSEEAKELIESGMSFTVNSYKALKEKALYAANNLVTDKQNKLVLKKYIESHLGGTELVYKAVQQYLKD